MRRYLAVGEHELALEGLCLELVDHSELALADLEKLAALAGRLGLDRESVFDAKLWDRLTAAVQRKRKEAPGASLGP